MSAFSKLPRNTKGSDYVVGDIHGAYSLLDDVMHRAGFDPSCDRLFSVGDLMDRGPESGSAIEFLNKPWFYPVRGNHEEMFLEIVREDGVLDEKAFDRHHRAGLGWIAHTDTRLLQNIAARVRALPYAIEFDTPRGSVGIVHAEVPPELSWKKFVAFLEKGNKTAIEFATWSRTRVQHNDQQGVEGIGRVFCGHTPQENGPKRLGNVYYVDTGAVFREIYKATEFGMTFTNSATITASIDQISTMQRTLVVSDPAMDRAFGKYAKPFKMRSS